VTLAQGAGSKCDRSGAQDALISNTDPARACARRTLSGIGNHVWRARSCRFHRQGREMNSLAHFRSQLSSWAEASSDHRAEASRVGREVARSPAIQGVRVRLDPSKALETALNVSFTVARISIPRASSFFSRTNTGRFRQHTLDTFDLTAHSSGSLVCWLPYAQLRRHRNCATSRR
jgi:hypothetical protein